MDILSLSLSLFFSIYLSFYLRSSLLILAFVVSRRSEIIRTDNATGERKSDALTLPFDWKYGIVSSANFRIQRISTRPQTLSLSLFLRAFINTISMDEPKRLIQRTWIFQRCWRVYVNRRGATRRYSVIDDRTAFLTLSHPASLDRYVIANGTEREHCWRSVSRRAPCVSIIGLRPSRIHPLLVRQCFDVSRSGRLNVTIAYASRASSRK